MDIGSHFHETRSWQFRVFAVVAFLLLFSSFHWNFFHIEQDQRQQNLSVDAVTLLPGLELYASGPWLLRDFGEMQQSDDGNITVTPYYMQVGLQRQFYNWISPDNLQGVVQAIPHLRTLIEAILAMTFTVFAAFVSLEFGYLTASVTVVCLALSNWLIVFAPDLYWICATFFLPFVLAWLFGDPDRPKKQRQLFAIGFTFFCLIKCLCGYEYITNIFAAVAVPFLYYGLRRGNSLRAIFMRTLRYGALSVGTFFIALLLQLAQFAFVQHDLDKGIAGFKDEAHTRTMTNGVGMSVKYDETVLSALHKLHVPPSSDAKIEPYLAHMRIVLRYFRYLSMGAVTVPLIVRSLTLPIGLFVVGFLAYFLFRRRQMCDAASMKETGRVPAWAWSTLLALVISHLWMVAANGHMTHTFFNAIIFYIPFLPMVFVFIGIVLASWIRPQERDGASL